jgi:uncharacterized protein YndB with AHSA1/START domain
MPPRPFTFDRSWRFACSGEQLWDVLADTDEYPRWWSWLDGFACDGLHEGATARFAVRPPLPYRLRLAVQVDEVVPGERVATTVGGDLAGRAHLRLQPAGAGTDVRMTWSLTLQRPALLAVERVARPAMVWGHDRVVAIGVDQFRRRALGHLEAGRHSG